MKAYPIFFEPDLKEKIWGGTKLKEIFKKKSQSDIVGESWEIAAHQNGTSIISNGELKGMTLVEAFETHKVELLGKRMENAEKFPLLLKIIDAKEQLSVQVHPEDVYAKINENGEYGKTEAWYVLHAQQGAKLVVGLKSGVTKEVFLKALAEEKLEEVLNEVEVKANDVINIPAGLVHAIGAGIVLAEIQQNSDTTYRVYDWNRKDKDGNGRELHIEKAIDVIDFEHKIPAKLTVGQTEAFGENTRTVYVENEYFTLEEYVISERYQVINKADEFELYLCIEGEGALVADDVKEELYLGRSVMIPAALKSFTIEGNLRMLRMRNK